MPIVILLVAVVLLVTAYKNNFGDLETALETDIPGFGKWFLALAAVGGIGYVPGLRTASRWMLGLVLLVLFVRNYKNVLGGFTGAVSTATPQAAVPTPAQAYVTNPGAPQITQAEITGTGNVNATTQPVVASMAGPYDPQNYLANYLQQAGVGTVFATAASGFGSFV